MDGFCLLVELHWEGSALHPGSQAYLEITAICHNFNLEKIYVLFGVKKISPELMVGKNLGHLEGLGYTGSGYD